MRRAASGRHCKAGRFRCRTHILVADYVLQHSRLQRGGAAARRHRAGAARPPTADATGSGLRPTMLASIGCQGCRHSSRGSDTAFQASAFTRAARVALTSGAPLLPPSAAAQARAPAKPAPPSCWPSCLQGPLREDVTGLYCASKVVHWRFKQVSRRRRRARSRCCLQRSHTYKIGLGAVLVQ